MTERNCVQEMRERIDAYQEPSDEPARDLAGKLFKEISHDDPALLAGWMEHLALSHLAAAFHQRRGSARQQERRAARAVLTRWSTVFTSPGADPAARALADDAMNRLATFGTRIVVNEDGETREVGKMNGADNLFVAARFERSSRRDGLAAQFYRKVAEKVGDRTVEDVFSVTTYVELRASIAGSRVTAGI